jgi:CRP-like cAMP-binding protein
MSVFGRARRVRELTRIDVFAECTRGQCRRIAEFSDLVVVQSGRVLCGHSTTAGEFFVIVDGEALVTVDNADAGTLGSGCGFAEVTLVTLHGRRTATVTATTAMTVLTFERAAFAALLAAAPSVARGVLQESTRRLATTAGRRDLAANP